MGTLRSRQAVPTAQWWHCGVPVTSRADSRLQVHHAALGRLVAGGLSSLAPSLSPGTAQCLPETDWSAPSPGPWTILQEEVVLAWMAVGASIEVSILASRMPVSGTPG